MSGPFGPLLLSDATMPVNFCLAGLPAAKAMAAFLGTDVHMVDEVHNELMRLADNGNAPLKALLESWPANPVISLTAELRESVTDAVRIRHLSTDHAGEDRGEVATVFWANERLITTGDKFVVMTDDGYGINLARDRGITHVKTPELIVQMVKHGALEYKDGQRVWSRCFSNQAMWKKYRDRVADVCPEKLPPPAAKKPGKGKGKGRGKK